MIFTHTRAYEFMEQINEPNSNEVIVYSVALFKTRGLLEMLFSAFKQDDIYRLSWRIMCVDLATTPSTSGLERPPRQC